MTCQQYVITHLLDPRDLSQILTTGKAASNEPMSSRSHLSTVVPGGSHTVLHVLDDAAQRQRAPLVLRTHIFTRISSWTVSYPLAFLSAREPQTSASLAKRRRAYWNIFCPLSPRAEAKRGSAACQDGSHVRQLQEVLNVMDENQKAFTGRCDRTGLHLPQRHVHINRIAVRSCPKLRSARTGGNGAMKW